MSQINTANAPKLTSPPCNRTFAEGVQLWLAEARKQGLNPLIHFGARSVEKQREFHDAFLHQGGPRAVAPERSYHCYGRAFDWVNITDADGGEKRLAFDDEKAYKKGTKIAEQFEIRGIGESDNDHFTGYALPDLRRSADIGVR
jgi:hypothetical protein